MDPQTLHRDSLVFDGHCDTLLAVLGREDMPEMQPRPLGAHSKAGHLDLPRMREGGVGAQVFACYSRWDRIRRPAAAQVLQLLDVFYHELEDNQDQIALTTTAAEIEAARAQGKIAATLAIEGGEALEGCLGTLRIFHRLGVRLLTLTWNFRNALGDGLWAARTGGGLTEFGVQVVQEMNRLGMLVDIAHLSPAGVEDVLKVSEAPAVASHANAKALCDFPRNLTDAQLEALAATGGLVGATFVPDFIAEDGGQASVQRLVDHIDHMVRVMGIDHVGLGSDWDGFAEEKKVQGLRDVADTPAITRELWARGYSPEDIRKILGENWLRVWRAVAG